MHFFKLFSYETYCKLSDSSVNLVYSLKCMFQIYTIYFKVCFPQKGWGQINEKVLVDV